MSLNQKQEEFDKLIKDIENVKCRWLEPLKVLIERRLCEKFSTAFESMGCVGEIQLSEHAENYAQVKKSICVHFVPSCLSGLL